MNEFVNRRRFIEVAGGAMLPLRRAPLWLTAAGARSQQSAMQALSLPGALRGKAPEAAYRPYLIWCWNAKLEARGIAGQVREFKQAGYGGFMVMPVAGTPYRVMEDAWLEAMDIALGEAEAQGLRAWIFDEWVFPSGIGGGAVTANPDFHARRLYLSMDVLLDPGQSISIEVPARTVAAGAVAINKYGGPAGAWKPLAASPGVQLTYRAGGRRERFFLVTWATSSAHQVTADGTDQHSVDMLNRRATRRFIEVIYERYAARVGHHFGKTVEGFFTDEPTLAFPFPWTEDFREEFRKRKGYDINPQIPFLVGFLQGQSTQPAPGTVIATRKVADDYLDVWTDLMAENYMGELESWCHQHGVRLLGNLDMEHRLHNLATVSGHFFKNNARNDFPSLDVIDRQILPESFTDYPRYAGSVARVLGKPRASSESLANMGFGMDANSIRYVLDHQIVRGVTHFFLMHRDYDPLLAPLRWPPDLSPANPVMAEFAPMLNERAGRLCQLMNAGRPMVEVGVYLPLYDIAAMQSFMAHPHAGNNRELPWEAVERIARHLAYLPCEFDYFWDEALLELPLVDGGLRSKHGHTYTTLILAPECTIKPRVARRLAEFKSRGGKLLALEQAPEPAASLAVLCPSLSDLSGHLRPPVKVAGQSRCISLSSRAEAQQDAHLMLNESPGGVEAVVEFEARGQILELDPLSGALRRLDTADASRLSLRFAPAALRVLVVDREYALLAEPPLAPSGDSLQLTDWSLTLPDGAVRSFRSELPDWSELGLNDFTGWLNYSSTFYWKRSERTATLDLGEVRYAAEVRLDGRPPAKLPFAPYETLLDGLDAGPHKVDVKVFNTLANRMVFAGKPFRQIDYDRLRLRSGLFGPVRLTALASADRKRAGKTGKQKF